jgi:hypothetical protein
MQPGNDKIVADRIYDFLSQKRSPKSASMPAPAATISGRWDATIEFFSSKKRAYFIHGAGWQLDRRIS